MEQTNLDKAVQKLFDGTKYVENKLSKINKSVYFWIFGCIIQIVNFILRITLTDNKWTILSSFLGMICTFYFSCAIIHKNLSPDFDFRLIKFTQKFYPEMIVKDCFIPIIADWREEYFLAISQNRKRKAFLINFQYIFIFILVMFQKGIICLLNELIHRFRK